MFERYTERARRVLFFARYEASQLGGSIIESEHLLLGLLHEKTGSAHSILHAAAVTLDAARQEVGRSTSGQAKLATHVEMPISPRAKEALQRAADESGQLRAAHVGTGHILLGLLHEDETVTARILGAAGLTLASARAAVAQRAARAHHIVLVQVRIRPELEEEFTAALLHNARESVHRDPGCLRFDVSQDKEDPTRWVLYEVYENPEAHAAHRQAPHFLAYDAVATRAVVEKSVSKCSGRHVT
jgi:quinol monooxygenase YgiN